MKKASLLRFYIFYGLVVFASNLVPPVTPTLVNSLHLQNYMFGLLFSVMSTSLFLFSPAWGKIGDIAGKPKTLAVGQLGYALGQSVFFFGGNGTLMILGRFISGMFMGSHYVNSMAYIIDMTDEKTRGKQMAFMAGLVTAMNALGYLVGGLIGDQSVAAVFYLQIALLLLAGVLFFLLLDDAPKFKSSEILSAKQFLKQANPLSSFVDAKDILNPALIVFFVMTFLSLAGSTGFDNSFDYYIKQQLGFPPSYNGVLKALVGVIGFIANVTINQWVAKKFQLRKAVAVVLACAGFAVLTVFFVSDLYLFVILCIMYYLFNAVYLPILQTLTSENTKATSGLISGVFNSSRSLGMIIGSLFAGFIYEIDPKLSFLTCAILFALASVMGIINMKQYQLGGKEKQGKESE